MSVKNVALGIWRLDNVSLCVGTLCKDLRVVHTTTKANVKGRFLMVSANIKNYVHFYNHVFLFCEQTLNSVFKKSVKLVTLNEATVKQNHYFEKGGQGTNK